MITLAAADLAGCFGLGVAGNFAGHLEQAGEAVDFADVVVAPEAPKGVFPWYVPGEEGFLGEFPLSSSELRLPGPEALQIEPEAGVICSVTYEGGTVAALAPEFIGAFNDCSIRRPGAKKISEKKNWGASSKGFARSVFEVSEIEREGATATLRLACFLRRGEEVHEYGIDSPVRGYSYYGTQLLDWIADRLRKQRGGEDSPLENVGAMLRECGSPARVLIGIGATRYTEFGERNFLQEGDESVVVLYDAGSVSSSAVKQAISARTELDLADSSVLSQIVVR